MTLDRRRVLLGGLGAGVGAGALAGARPAQARTAIGAPVTDFGVRADASEDQTRALQRAIDALSARGTPVLLPPGTYRVRRLELRAGTRLVGVPGASVLRYAGESGFLALREGGDIAVEGLVLDGGGRPLGGGNAGLVAGAGVSRLTIRDCRLTASTRHGIAVERCGGAVSDCQIETVAATGVFCLDATGLEIVHNRVRDCGNNGIQVWRSEVGEDGTVVAHNRVERIRADGGGSGQNGNAVNLFRAGSVLVTGNRLADCAFTAVRANAASNCQMIGNSCARLGEVALYAEFGFEGSVIANNLVESAAAGISVTNFNEGGRLAVVQGNLVRGLFLRRHEEPRGFGIGVEADTLVTGNVIEDAPAMGIGVGWGAFLRDVTVTANIVRKARIGIGVSAVAGAGHALVTNNMISDARDGGIRAMNFDKPMGRDLARTGEEAFRNIAAYGNVALP